MVMIADVTIIIKQGVASLSVFSTDSVALVVVVVVVVSDVTCIDEFIWALFTVSLGHK